jgi:class 3 adenylate cyclase
VDILVAAASCAYFAEPNLLPLVGMTTVRLSLEHGNCGLSAYGYAVYGLVLCGALHRIEEGYAFGQLANALLERYPARELVKVRFVVDAFVRHYKEPLADIPADLLDVWRRSLDVGDVETAVYCCGASVYDAYFAGTNIPSVLERHGPAIRHMQASNQEHAKPGFNAWVELLEALVDVTRRDGRLAGETFDLEAWIPKLEGTRNVTGLAYASTAAGILAAIHGDLATARTHLARASGSSMALVSQSIVPQLHFYRAMVDLRMARESNVSPFVRARLLVSARADAVRLELWARHAPETFGSKVTLLEALELSARGRVGSAIERFQRAIDGAQRAGFIHEAAMAAELLAEHCARARLDELSVHYLRRAQRLYSLWGARGKARALEVAHWDVFRAPEYLGELRTAGDTTGDLDEQLDVASVVKAVSTLSEEMDLDRLLSRLMRVVIENAGAERAVLLTMRDGGLRVEAEGGLEGTTVHVDGPTADDPSSGVSPAIAAYAARSRQSVVLADAMLDPLFARDPWVTRRRAKSILCAPLLRSGALTGLVFLENTLVAGAFTQNRVRVLEIICGQAAVSIESARLYESLERALESQVRLTTAHSRFVPHQFLQALDRENIVDVELGDHASKEMSVLFSDIRGFARHMERLDPARGIEFLNTYLSRMEAPILAHGGFVDSYVGDAIMALFERSADHAVRAGIGMLAALSTLNRERERVGEPPIHEGIGINTGTLMLGTIGGRNHLKCGVIGDSVNVAARIETLTKHYRVSMLVGGTTFDRLEDPSRYMHRRIGRVRVVGRESPVTLYEIYDGDPSAQRDAKAAIAASFDAALTLFYERDFAGAAALLEQCTRRAPDDWVSAIHLERARRLAAEGVDEDWDGVVRLEKK